MAITVPNWPHPPAMSKLRKSAASVRETLRRHESEGWFLPGHNRESLSSVFAQIPELKDYMENAAVLACISYDDDGHLEVLLTKRSEQVSKNKGKWNNNAYMPLQGCQGLKNVRSETNIIFNNCQLLLCSSY